MMPAEDTNVALFREAVQGLQRGDFSRLAPLFEDRPLERRPCQVMEWYDKGYFAAEPAALTEALTCACFLGRTGVAEFLLDRAVDPTAGTGTGLSAFHWAANRGQLETVRLLIKRRAPLETRSMYGGTVLGTAVWSAINEPKPDHAQIIEELLVAGARSEDAGYPTGHEQIDAVLRRYGAT
jgi:hypothetical protein